MGRAVDLGLVCRCGRRWWFFPSSKRIIIEYFIFLNAHSIFHPTPYLHPIPIPSCLLYPNQATILIWDMLWGYWVRNWRKWGCWIIEFNNNKQDSDLLNMLVTRISLRTLRLLPRLNNTFARKKDKRGRDDDDGAAGQQKSALKEEVKIDEKQINKSAALYDQYVKSRSKPMLTLDGYQIKFVYVIQRAPIFLPYDPKRFDYYRTKYQYLKKTGYYPEIPKELQVDTGDYLFTEYERVNPQNEVTHRNKVSKTEVYEYMEHSRYWKYTDPTIRDPHSIQTYSSDNVYLITKNHDGKWEFPSKVLSEKDNHKEIFKVMNNELFAGGPSPIVYFAQQKPIYARKIDDESLTRGKGFAEYFFRGLSLNGIPKFPTQNFADYAWVPKPQLGEYFADDYFEQTIKLTVHLC